MIRRAAAEPDVVIRAGVPAPDDVALNLRQAARIVRALGKDLILEPDECDRISNTIQSLRTRLEEAERELATWQDKRTRLEQAVTANAVLAEREACACTLDEMRSREYDGTQFLSPSARGALMAAAEAIRARVTPPEPSL